MIKKKVICGIQIQSYPFDVEKNTSKITEWIETASKKFKPSLVVFPESVTTGFTPTKPLKSFISVLKKELPKTLKAVSETAKRFNTAVVLPTYEPINDGILANNAIVIDEKGKIRGRYSKMFPFQKEIWTKPGSKMKTFTAGKIKFGITICYDGDFPALSQKAAMDGVELVVRPSAVLRDFSIWRMVNRARAYDNQIYFMGVNACGPDSSGKLFFGHSMIINPYARVISTIGINEGFIHSDIKPKSAIKDHNVVKIDHIKDIKKLHPIKLSGI